MKLYRICTEAKNVKAVAELVSQRFKEFSLWQGIGYWQGKSEKSLCIEIFDPTESCAGTVEQLALEIRVLNEQDCVLVQEIECKGRSI